MEIFIDSEPVALTCDDLEAALEAANEHLAPTGRIIVEVEADGHTLTGEDLEKQRSTGGAPTRLNLQSADPRDLVIEALEQVREGLSEAQRHQVEAAESLQRDDAAQAMDKIRVAVDRWQDLQRVVVQTGSLVRRDIGAIRVADGSVEDAVVALADRLRDLSALLTTGDTVALADELMYVWPGICEQWERTLEAIITEVNGTPPTMYEPSS